MSANPRTKIEIFKAGVQNKIQGVLKEFSEGKLNREQFQSIYQHYTDQLALVDQALAQGQMSSLTGVAGGTIAIRQAHMGKAIGLVIYHNKSGMLVDTLGDFPISPAHIAPTLNDFSLQMESGALIDRKVEKVADRQWLLYAAGKYSTVVTLFQNEPSQQQSREIERLHHDFETANGKLLAGNHVDSRKLAYPFLTFVEQKIKGKK
jgi:hypothetical protein